LYLELKEKLDGNNEYNSDPLVILVAFVVSVVADGAKATPLVFVQVIVPVLANVQSPDITTGAGAPDPLPTRMSPLGRPAQAVVELPLESEPLAVSNCPDTMFAPVNGPVPLHVAVPEPIAAIVGGPAYPEPGADTVIVALEEFRVTVGGLESAAVSVTVAVAPVPPPPLNATVHVLELDPVTETPLICQPLMKDPSQSGPAAGRSRRPLKPLAGAQTPISCVCPVSDKCTHPGALLEVPA
jgi:hypothetical protein